MPNHFVHELARENVELKARIAELSRSLAHVEAVSQLTAGVVHDLRNAFQVALSAGEALHESVQEPMQLEMAETVVAAGRHATELARDLLAVARKEDARTSVVNCSEFLANFERLIRRVATSRLECTFRVDPGVGSFEVERPQLEAALINLSVNARDAMPNGGRLRIAARNLPPEEPLPPGLPPDDYIELCVEDNGSGMPLEVLARATEAFFTTKQTRGGTGLGLAMAQSFAQRSGGALAIESVVGRGTRVRVLLPQARPSRRTLANVTDQERAKLQRIQSRIRRPWFHNALEEWHAACPPNGLPKPVALEAGLREHADCSIVLSVQRGATPPALQLVRIGDGLARALGPGSFGDVPIEGSVVLGSLDAAYRRALHSSFPSHEYARYALGDGSPGEFERLILPAAVDGRSVSHLIGVIYLSPDLLVGRTESHVRLDEVR